MTAVAVAVARRALAMSQGGSRGTAAPRMWAVAQALLDRTAEYGRDAGRAPAGSAMAGRVHRAAAEVRQLLDELQSRRQPDSGSGSGSDGEEWAELLAGSTCHLALRIAHLYVWSRSDCGQCRAYAQHSNDCYRGAARRNEPRGTTARSVPR